MLHSKETLRLIQKSLRAQHKLKVHRSMNPPDNHEELSQLLISQWDLEDEISVIQELIVSLRERNRLSKKNELKRELHSLFSFQAGSN